MSTYDNLIKEIRSSGKMSFTLEEAKNISGISIDNIASGMYRQRREGNIVNPVQGLYIIVPPEYSDIGCLPPHLLIPLIMDHWKINYYACLLSACSFHGASHQKPQIFQVMVSKRIRNIHCGKVRIEFITKSTIDEEWLTKKVVDTGYLKISSPEITLIDLMNYMNRAGGINHVCTLVSELIEAIDPKKLIEAAKVFNAKSWVQRLGFILDNIDPVDEVKWQEIRKALEQYIENKKLYYVPLDPQISNTGFPYNKKWKIIENTTIESDI